MSSHLKQQSYGKDRISNEVAEVMIADTTQESEPTTDV